MVMDNPAKASKQLKEGIEKFKEDAKKKGWEEDEVEEKITEVFHNFPWYKFHSKKKSWKSIIGNTLLYIFISYLALTAVLERNLHWKKKYNDFFFDQQYAYHLQRVLRFMTVPIFRIHDISAYHNDECLIKNPFLPPGELSCDFCEGIDAILDIKVKSVDLQDMIKDGTPFKVPDVPGYYDNNVGFLNFKQLVMEHKTEIDDATCDIKLTNFKKISEYFQLTEEQVVEKNMSIGWRNCDTYGTRFYRRLFSRPSFIAKDSEVFLEKEVYMLQEGVNITMPNMEGETFFMAQAQGQSEISMAVMNDCHQNCTSKPLTKILNRGEILISPNSNGWVYTLKSTSPGLSIVYFSGFT